MSQNPYSAPQIQTGSYSNKPVRGGRPIQYAGFWVRFVAAFIDGLIIGIVSFPIGFVLGIAMVTAQIDPESIGPQLFLRLIGVVIGWLYGAIMESSSAQATFGKQAMGLRVVDERGQPISFGRASGRHFGKFLSGALLLIGYIMAAFTEKKQALHDMMSGCLVVVK